MKQKWVWIAAAVVTVALLALVLWLTVFSPQTDPEQETTPSTTTTTTANTTTTTTSTPAEEVIIPGRLSFVGKVLEKDGDSVLMECFDKEKFDTVWANIAQTGVSPKVGEEYTVVYEDLVMPSLPPRITAVKMTLA